MSHGYCPYTTVAAVQVADTILGPGRKWSAHDKVQAGWLDRYFRPIATKLPELHEIVSQATSIPAKHVSFLRRHGWNAELKECKPGQLLTAGLLDLLVKWKEEGVAVPLKAADGNMYPGALLKGGIEYWQLPNGVTAACIATQSTDRVWLAMTDTAPTQLELSDMAKALIGGQKQRTNHSYLHFPMIDLAARETLDFITGLSTLGQDGKEWTILEAVQQITLKMNHKGAHARAADEMRMGPTSVQHAPPPMVIDKPFVAIFERPGMPQPIFVAYATQETWKDPGELKV